MWSIWSIFTRKPSGSDASFTFFRNIFKAVPKARVKEVAAMLKTIHAQEDQSAAEEKIIAITKKLKSMKLTQAARIVEEGAKETMAYYDFPSHHWRSL